jgi:hypothetical protein
MKETLRKANQSLLEGDRDGVLELLGDESASSDVIWLRANSVKSSEERLSLLSQLVDGGSQYSQLAEDVLAREHEFERQLKEPPDYQFWKQPTWAKRLEKMRIYRMWVFGGVLLVVFGIIGTVINSRSEAQFREEVAAVQATQTAQAYFSGSQFAQYDEGIVSIVRVQDPVDTSSRPVTAGNISDGQYVTIQPANGARFVAVYVNFQCLKNTCSNPPEAQLGLLLQDRRTTDFYSYASHYFFVDEPPDPIQDRLANERIINLWFVFEVSRNTSPTALLVVPDSGGEPLIVSWPVR